MRIKNYFYACNNPLKSLLRIQEDLRNYKKQAVLWHLYKANIYRFFR